MIDITDRSHKPSLAEIDEFIENPLFGELREHLESAYGAQTDVVYSGEKMLLGWNIPFYKSGRTLCRLYPKRSYFCLLVVIGRKEKERVETLLPFLSGAMQRLYQTTQEGMGQRWLLIDLSEPNALYQDVLQIIAIRRASK